MMTPHIESPHQPLRWCLEILFKLIISSKNSSVFITLRHVAKTQKYQLDTCFLQCKLSRSTRNLQSSTSWETSSQYSNKIQDQVLNRQSVDQLDSKATSTRPSYSLLEKLKFSSACHSAFFISISISFHLHLVSNSSESNH